MMPTESSLGTVLVAEDDAGLRATLAEEFSERGYVVTAVASLEELETLPSLRFRYAVLDRRLGADDGLEVLRRLRTADGAVRAVILTGYGSIPSTVRAMRDGAVDYLAKPVAFRDLEQALLGRASAPAEREAPAPSLARNEREYIDFVLESCDGNITQAAKKLGIHRQSLQRKLRKFPPRV